MPSLSALPEIDTSKLSQAELVARAEALDELHVKEARERADAFTEYVLTHEETGDPIVNAPFHIEWHRFLDEHPLAVLIAPVEHAKTQQIAVGRALYMLGKFPNKRGAIISNTSGQAEKILSSIKQYIEHSDRLHKVFPNLRPSEAPGLPWHGSAITVERNTIAKDPSIQALGIGGGIVGSRLDWIILDDVLDFENTRTDEQVQKLLEWFDSTLFTRRTAGGVVWMIGTPWNKSDLIHTLAARPAWASKRYSAVENPHDPPNAWRPIWFSLPRLLEIYENTTPHNFSRKYLCIVIDTATSRFKTGWIEQCKALGKGRTLLPRAPVTPSGKRLPCFTGVDLAGAKRKNTGKKRAGGALTVFFTIAVDQRGRRIVVDVRGGNWTGPDIVTELYDIHARYDSMIVVEDNGTQQFLLQFATQGGIPVKEFTTGMNKYDETFGVESMAIEMRSGLWVIPSGETGQHLDPNVQRWLAECLAYQPNAHTGDYLMASWFAREAARSAFKTIQRSMDTTYR